jgi:DHA1 family bicyclomycin/chloramphenicol resistance-like MFS transporter
VQKQDTGSASALINCFALMFGSFGMILASIGGNNHIVTLDTVNILVGLICLWA